MKKALTEPLVHFVVLGAALFGVYALIEREPQIGVQQVIVSAGQIEHLATTFGRTWQRPPTADELKGLIDDYVAEEILAREAIKLGLNQDDTVIRRRLRQKMEFISEDLSAAVEPTEEELEAYFNEHADDFRQDARYWFRHVFVSADHGEQAAPQAHMLLDQLRVAGDADVSALGDRLMLPMEFADEPAQSIASQFGGSFGEQLEQVKVGEWSGPLRSGYGLHLVLVTQKSAGRLPPMAEVRDAVMRELMNQRRVELNRQFLEGLLSKYEVIVQWHSAAEAADAASMPGVR